jgi:drug/metabolite transporter (DMT)-like permease
LEKRKKKFLGVCIAFIGVFFARLENFIPLQSSLKLPIYLFGVTVALAGLAVFASGLRRGKMNGE